MITPRCGERPHAPSDLPFAGESAAGAVLASTKLNPQRNRTPTVLLVECDVTLTVHDHLEPRRLSIVWAITSVACLLQ